MDKKYVYLFREGNANMRELLGGKGANLAEMTNLGLPIPQGFTITTEACIEYYNNNENISEEIKYQIFMSLKELERILENNLEIQQIHYLYQYVQVQEHLCLV